MVKASNGVAPADEAALRDQFDAEAPLDGQVESEGFKPEGEVLETKPSEKVAHGFSGSNTFDQVKNFSDFKTFKIREKQAEGSYWAQFLDFLHPKLLDDNQEGVLEDIARTRQIMLLSSTKMLKERLARKSKLVTGIVYIFFMVIFFFIIIAQRHISDSFKLEYALSSQIGEVEDASGNTYQDVGTHEELIDWIDTGLFPKIFPTQVWYNGDKFTDFEKNYFLEYNRIVGGIKLGQRRVDPKLCYHSDESVTDYFNEYYDNVPASSEVCSDRFNEYYPILFPPYSDKTNSKAAFGPTYDHSKFTWEKDEYNGGYFVHTVADSKLAYKVIEELKANKWIDKSTRTVEVSFAVYNGNYKMFTTVSMVFDLLATGLIKKKIRMGTFMIENYLSTSDKIRGGFEVFFIVYIIASIFGEWQEFYSRRFGEKKPSAHVFDYFSSFWNWIDLLRICSFLASIFGWVRILNHYVGSNLELPLPTNSVYYDFEPLATLHKTQEIINSAAVIICLMTCFKYAHYSPKFGILVLTIIKAMPDLIQFLYMFATCFLVFDVMGMMMFGSNLAEWSTFYKGVQTLIMMLTAEYGLGPLVAVDANKGVLFYFLFLVIAYFLLVNILLAILIDAYTALREDNAARDYAEQDSLTFSVPSEVIGEFRFRILRIIHKFGGSKSQSTSHTFITTNEMVAILEGNPAMLDEAKMVPGRKTMKNPNPEPEFVVTLPLLLKCCPVQRARLMMAAIGVEILEKEVEEAVEDVRRQSTEVFETPAIQAVRRMSEVVDDKVSELGKENAALKETMTLLHTKLDHIAHMITPPSPPVGTPQEGEIPDPHNRHATYNAIYNSIYRNIS